MFHNDRRNRKNILEMTPAEVEVLEEDSKRMGFSAQEAGRISSVATSAGVKKCWRAKMLILQQAQATVDRCREEEETDFARTRNLFGKERANQKLRERQTIRADETALAEGRTPVWRHLCGLPQKEEYELEPDERALKIAYLLGEVESMLRVEMAHVLPAIRARNGGPGIASRPGNMWDPLRAVCVHLGISQRKLSMYSKELNGMSAPEIVDCIRVESVQVKMKEFLKRFVAEWFAARKKEGGAGSSTNDAGGATARQAAPSPGAEAPPSPHGGEGNGRMVPLAQSGESPPTRLELAEAIWNDLRKQRRAPRWDRAAWAWSFGFSSYSKFFRACMLSWSMGPHQLEIQLLDEILEEADEIEAREASAEEADAAGADGTDGTKQSGKTVSTEKMERTVDPAPRE